MEKSRIPVERIMRIMTKQSSHHDVLLVRASIADVLRRIKQILEEIAVPLQPAPAPVPVPVRTNERVVRRRSSY
jgi:hypothetical protein